MRAQDRPDLAPGRESHDIVLQPHLTESGKSQELMLILQRPLFDLAGKVTLKGERRGA